MSRFSERIASKPILIYTEKRGRKINSSNSSNGKSLDKLETKAINKIKDKTANKSENGESTEYAENSESTEHSEITKYAENSEITEHGDITRYADNSENSDNTEYAENSEITENSDTEHAENSDHAEDSETAENSENTEYSDNAVTGDNIPETNDQGDNTSFDHANDSSNNGDNDLNFNMPADPPDLGNNLALGICLRPNTYNGDVSQSKNWLDRFIAYVELLRLPDESKAKTMGLLLEGEATTWYNELTNAQKGNWVDMQRLFKERFKEQAEHIFERRMGLASRTQVMGENVETYLKDICKQMSGLNMDAEAQMAQIINGLEPSMKMRILEFMPFANVQSLKDKIRQLSLSRKVLGSQLTSAAQKTEQGTTNENEKIIGELTNIKRQLYNMNAQTTTAPFNRQSRSFSRGRGARPNMNNRIKRCYNCGSTQHLIANCTATRSSPRRNLSPRFISPRRNNNFAGQRRVRFYDEARNNVNRYKYNREQSPASNLN